MMIMTTTTTNKRRNKRVKIISIILAGLMLLGTFTFLAALIPANAAGLTDYSDITVSVQSLGWYNHQHNGTGSFTTVAKKASTSLTDSYVDANGVVYGVKVINDTTCQITSVATPIDPPMEEIKIPAYLDVYRLQNLGKNTAIGADTFFKGRTMTEDGQVYSWDFSDECVYKYDKEGELVSVSEPIAKPEKHRFQVVDVTKSFSSTQTTVKKVILPSLVKTVAVSGFMDNPYIEEVIGLGVQEVSSKSFYNCKNLKSVEFPNIRYVRDNAFYKCNALEDFDFTNVLSIGVLAFFDCVKFKNVKFSPELQQLEKQAFKQCTGIESIDFPAGISIATIPEECFYLCSSLKDIVLPYEIINIGKKAFYNCTALRKLDFRDANLDTIGNQAFWGCSRLSFVILPKTLVTFAVDAFDNCTELRYVYFGSELSDSQLKALQKSDLAKCVVTEIDKEGPAIYDATEKTYFSSPVIYIYKPSKLVVYDVIDVDFVTVSGKSKVPSTEYLSDEFHTYPTYVQSMNITTKGTYTIIAKDILGNRSEYTVMYTDLPGDIDQDGNITAADARLALRAAVELEHYAVGTEKFALADYDRNGKITSADARYILRVAVGLEPFANSSSTPQNGVVNVGDTIFESDGMRVTYQGYAKQNDGLYSITVKYENTTSTYKEGLIMWMANGRYNWNFKTLINSGVTTGNTSVLKNFRSLDNVTLYFKVFANAGASAQFSGLTTENQLKQMQSASFKFAK